MHVVAVVVLLFSFLLPSAVSQSEDGPLPSSWPHKYPGQPSGPFSPLWQPYFQVTKKLPNVTFTTSRSFAGNIPVDRPGHPNDTLFFWAYEKKAGSLTSAKSNEPWGIWLNGGPGASSIWGMLFENGPIQITPQYAATANKYSWDKLADFIWVDQPVGSGFATADSEGYIADDDQMGVDFMGFLANLVKVFPSLATRPLYLNGESYAGVWIPYILKAYFNMAKPPVQIAKIVIGDGSIPSGQVFQLLPALSVLQTYPQIIGYDTEVYKYFKEQSKLCNFDIDLKYPQDGLLPFIPLVMPTSREVIWFQQNSGRASVYSQIAAQYVKRQLIEGAPDPAKREEEHALWKRDHGLTLAKRDLSGRTNGSVDPWYGCLLLDMFIDYAINFTFPWTLSQDTEYFGFDPYNIPDALVPQVNRDASVFLNDPRTKAAIHAPQSKDWQMRTSVVYGKLGLTDPSPEPMVFLTDLATNATKKGVKVVLYSANNDALIAHRGTEVAIQNTTFGGIQGFTRKPSTPWYGDDGSFAGIVHQERNWTYVLFDKAGHMVPTDSPANAFTFLREFVLGNNKTGSVVKNLKGDVVVIGGENATLAEDVLPGGDEIYYGAGATQSTYVFPSATRAAWREFIKTETAVPKVLSQNAGHPAFLPVCGTLTITLVVMVLSLLQHL